MDNVLPKAKSSPLHLSRDRLRKAIARNNLCGLANDTKWDEFISAMRERKDWRPSYRCKCVDCPPSYWDVEWFYHLPFPFISVEWLDVGFLELQHRGGLLAPEIIDHSFWIEEMLRRIGLEYEKGRLMIRIFGYSPKNYELFE